MNKLFCMDVDYRNDSAVAAGVLFSDWTSDEVELETTVQIDELAPYEPGEFYKRELPCLVALINSLPSLPTLLIVDGFVYLDDDKSNGLGGYLFDAFDGAVPVIGVAKNRFQSCTIATEVTRGESAKPLFITSVGIDQAEAAELIKNMPGEFRVPTLLKHVDQLCRRK